MAARVIPYSILVLRIFTLLSLAASIVLLVTNNYSLADGTKTSFKDVISYRYLLSTAAIGSAYTLIQLPLAVYHAKTEKRLIRNECLPTFDFYGDKVISFLLASGVGVGFAVSFEFKKFLSGVFLLLVAINIEEADEFKSKAHKFFDRGIIATAVLCVGFLCNCMAALSILSSINRTTSRGFFG